MAPESSVDAGQRQGADLWNSAGDGNAVRGQPLDKGGEHGTVGPVHARTWVGATQDGDLVAQHEELNVLGGGRSGHQ